MLAACAPGGMLEQLTPPRYSYSQRVGSMGSVWERLQPAGVQVRHGLGELPQDSLGLELP